MLPLIKIATNITDAITVYQPGIEVPEPIYIPMSAQYSGTTIATSVTTPVAASVTSSTPSVDFKAANPLVKYHILFILI